MQRRKLTAWIGLLAIWLAVLMPLASQHVSQQHKQSFELSFCLPGQPDTVLALNLPVPGNDQADHGIPACDYCGLLAEHPPLLFAAVHHPHAALWARPYRHSSRYTHTGAQLYSVAQARAPPSLFS